MALAIVAVVAGTAAGLARQTGVPAVATLWAEDGRVFLQQALALPALDAVFRPYAGYLHIPPRIFAELATAVPLTWADAVLSGAAALVVACLAVVVFFATADHIRTAWVRALLAASVVLLPTSSEEVLNNVANLQWFFLFASFWVLLWNGRRTWELAVGATVVLLTGLSEPLTLLLAPLALLRLAALGRSRQQVVTAAFFGGLALQLAGMALGHATRELPLATSVVKIPAWYGSYVIGQGMLGSRIAGDPDGIRALALAGLAGLLLAALAVVAVHHRAIRRTALPVSALAAGYSVVLFVVPVFLSGVSTPRYTVAPALLLYSAIAVVGQACVTVLERAGARRVVATGSALVALIVMATSFAAGNPRSAGPRWDDGVATARTECATSPTQGQAAFPADPADAGARTVLVPISPPGWDVIVPCRELTTQ